MNNSSNFSSILSQLNQLSNLQNWSKSFQLPESALSIIQQISNISDISDINSNLSTIADQLAIVSKLDIPTLTNGITFETNIVKISPQAMKTLDSLQKHFSKENTNNMTDSSTDNPCAPPLEFETPNMSTKGIDNQDTEAEQLPSPDFSSKKNVESEIYELPSTDFNNKYQPLLEKLLSVLIIPFMIAYIFRTDITPLTNTFTSFLDEYIRIENQKANDRQEDRKLLNSILDAINESNELQKSQIESTHMHNKLLEHQLKTNHEYRLREEFNESKQ